MQRIERDSYRQDGSQQYCSAVVTLTGRTVFCQKEYNYYNDIDKHFEYVVPSKYWMIGACECNYEFQNHNSQVGWIRATDWFAEYDCDHDDYLDNKRQDKKFTVQKVVSTGSKECDNCCWD